jgi:hypothetical protein
MLPPFYSPDIASLIRATYTKARRLLLVVAECVERVGAMQKALDRGIGNDLVRRCQQHRLSHLMVPGAHADRQTFAAIEIAVAQDERALLGEIGGFRPQRRLHDHPDRHPGCPIGPFHVPATGFLLEA